MNTSAEIQIYCLVDNGVLSGSQLWGEHGVSFLVVTSNGQVLFDTGQSGLVLLHNLRCLRLAPKRINALALSHGHYDHTGGLRCLLTNLRSGLPLYASPHVLQPHYTWRDDQAVSIGMALNRQALERRLDLRLSAAPAEILPGVWTTGEINKRPEVEGRSAQHCIYVNNEWQPDPYQDDISLVVEHPAGLIVICGCCHAGLLNTLAHIQRVFGQNILAILGGSHLSSAPAGVLAGVVERLRTLNQGAPPQLYLNHCTGERAFLALAQAFGEQVQACPAGSRLAF